MNLIKKLALPLSLGLLGTMTLTSSAFAERNWCSGSEGTYQTCRQSPGGETVTSCGDGTYIPGNVTNRDWVDSRCAALKQPKKDTLDKSKAETTTNVQ